MNLNLAELNELVYCVGRVIAEDPNGWNVEVKKALFDKLYTELEQRTGAIEDEMRKQGFVPINEFQHFADIEAQDFDTFGENKI